MASANHCSLLLLAILATYFTDVISFNVSIKASLMYPYSCSGHIQTCSSYIYHVSEGFTADHLASLYSVNSSNITPIPDSQKQDYLISVPCTCKDVNGTYGYFYDTYYEVQLGDTFVYVTSVLYGGQAWKNEDEQFVAGSTFTVHLLCGCTEVESQEIVTYTVQENDTLWGISELLSAEQSEIQSLNARLTRDPSYIDVGWVLIFLAQARKKTPFESSPCHIVICHFMFNMCSDFSLDQENKTPCKEKGKSLQMAEISRRCLSEDPSNRPEMREIVHALAQISASSIEWEASLGGSSEDLRGVLAGR